MKLRSNPLYSIYHKVILREVRLLKTRTNELEAQNSTRNT
jgi:hypothetical protein